MFFIISLLTSVSLCISLLYRSLSSSCLCCCCCIAGRLWKSFNPVVWWRNWTGSRRLHITWVERFCWTLQYRDFTASPMYSWCVTALISNNHTDSVVYSWCVTALISNNHTDSAVYSWCVTALISNNHSDSAVYSWCVTALISNNHTDSAVYSWCVTALISNNHTDSAASFCRGIGSAFMTSLTEADNINSGN